MEIKHTQRSCINDFTRLARNTLGERFVPDTDYHYENRGLLDLCFYDAQERKHSWLQSLFGPTDKKCIAFRVYDEGKGPPFRLGSNDDLIFYVLDRAYQPAAENLAAAYETASGKKVKIVLER